MSFFVQPFQFIVLHQIIDAATDPKPSDDPKPSGATTQNQDDASEDDDADP